MQKACLKTEDGLRRLFSFCSLRYSTQLEVLYIGARTGSKF